MRRLTVWYRDGARVEEIAALLPVLLAFREWFVAATPGGKSQQQEGR